MAALAGDLSKQILGHSDATKAFRPWWDVVQDGIMYSLVVMGKCWALFLYVNYLLKIIINFWFFPGVVTLPMTFMTRTPVDCVIHPSMWQPNSSSTHIMDSNQLVSIKCDTNKLTNQVIICFADSVRSVSAHLRQVLLHRDDGLALPHLLPLYPLPRPHTHHIHREGAHQVCYVI